MCVEGGDRQCGMQSVYRIALALLVGISCSSAFHPSRAHHIVSHTKAPLRMILDHNLVVDLAAQGQNHFWAWTQLGLANSDAPVVAATAAAKVCPNFGESGWAPFCFLNGNPVFNAFDSFQLFIQNSVVSLHDFLHNAGIEHAYGPSIILFTIFVRAVLFPLNYQQIASTQMVTALNPKVQEIREKYPDNKELQAQMTALLYQEAKVIYQSIIIIEYFQLFHGNPVVFTGYRRIHSLVAFLRCSKFRCSWHCTVPFTTWHPPVN